MLRQEGRDQVDGDWIGVLQTRGGTRGWVGKQGGHGSSEQEKVDVCLIAKAVTIKSAGFLPG